MLLMYGLILYFLDIKSHENIIDKNLKIGSMDFFNLSFRCLQCIHDMGYSLNWSQNQMLLYEVENVVKHVV